MLHESPTDCASLVLFIFLWKQIKTYFKMCFLWLMKTCKMWASFAKQRSAKRMQHSTKHSASTVPSECSLGRSDPLALADASINNDSVARAKLDSSNFYYFQENSFFLFLIVPLNLSVSVSGRQVGDCPVNWGITGLWLSQSHRETQRDTGGEREMIS